MPQEQTRCQKPLQDVVEEWIVLRLKRVHELPTVTPPEASSPPFPRYNPVSPKEPATGSRLEFRSKQAPVRSLLQCRQIIASAET